MPRVPMQLSLPPKVEVDIPGWPALCAKTERRSQGSRPLLGGHAALDASAALAMLASIPGISPLSA
jgi:hypothetical protein